MPVEGRERETSGLLNTAPRLRDDDLAYLLSMTALKDLHKLCAKLRDDRFLAMYVLATVPASVIFAV